MSAILFGAGHSPMKHISSRNNPLVATFRALSRGRDSGQARMLLDGAHLVGDALASGIRIEVAVVARPFAASREGTDLLWELTSRGTETLTASDGVIQAMSPVSAPSGIVAIAGRPGVSLAGALLRPPQLVVAALDVQEPGNVGAIARAAEAGGATGVAFCGASADPFGWKALRGSMGSLFRLPTAAGERVEAVVMAARAADVRILAAVPRGGSSPYDLDFRGPTAFVLGGEGPGLPDHVMAVADERVSIPMQAPVESLNVAVAAAILVYEAARQRGAAPRRAADPGSR